jgi:hypothetical protein
LADRDLHVKAFHALLLLALGAVRALRTKVTGLQATTGPQDGPQSAAQQFSVRKATSAFIASKFAA